MGNPQENLKRAQIHEAAERIRAIAAEAGIPLVIVSNGFYASTFAYVDGKQPRFMRSVAFLASPHRMQAVGTFFEGLGQDPEAGAIRIENGELTLQARDLLAMAREAEGVAPEDPAPAEDASAGQDAAPKPGLQACEHPDAEDGRCPDCGRIRADDGRWYWPGQIIRRDRRDHPPSGSEGA